MEEEKLPSSTTAQNNRRIAKNTMMLYFRMILTMLVSLYTSRVILNTLGVEDYGIYNVVGGFVGMFGFLNSSMASATQRFMAFEIGRNDKQQLRNVFSMSINIHFIIALFILLLAGTVGLWFFNTQLTIPMERMDAARWVYLFSVSALAVSIISVPYNSMIIAHERMNVFAWISIVEVVLKLLIVFMLQWFGFDKLKLYAILTFSVSLIIRIFYGIYCQHAFKGNKYRFKWESQLFKRMFSHSGWMLFGTSTNMLSNQGVNVLMNIFFGVTVNAARGIAFQIQNVVTSFVSNFMMAVQPQIIKYYSQGRSEEMYRLVFTSSKFSFFLMFFLSLPVLLLTEPLILWWLKMVPDHVVLFTKLTIVNLFFTVLYSPIASVSQASGKIKYYQLTIAVGFLLAFIFTYVFFKIGFPSYFAFIIMIATSAIGLITRLIVLNIQVSFPVKEYLKKVISKIMLVLLFSIPLPVILNKHIVSDARLHFLSVLFASFISVFISVIYLGLERNERSYFLKLVKVKLTDRR